MFALFRMRSALRVWQIHYCESDFARCVRYQRGCSADQVSPNLLPNGEVLALPFVEKK